MIKTFYSATPATSKCNTTVDQRWQKLTVPSKTCTRLSNNKWTYLGRSWVSNTPRKVRITMHLWRSIDWERICLEKQATYSPEYKIFDRYVFCNFEMLCRRANFGSTAEIEGIEVLLSVMTIIKLEFEGILSIPMVHKEITLKKLETFCYHLCDIICFTYNLHRHFNLY